MLTPPDSLSDVYLALREVGGSLDAWPSYAVLFPNNVYACVNETTRQITIGCTRAPESMQQAVEVCVQTRMLLVGWEVRLRDADRAGDAA